MIIDRTELEEFPFTGAFYKYSVDKSKPLDEQEVEETLVFETKCDIQENQKTDTAGKINATFNVYFPFDTEEGICITRDMIFRGCFYGLNVNGQVIGIFPTLLGRCVVWLKDRDAQ